MPQARRSTRDRRRRPPAPRRPRPPPRERVVGDDRHRRHSAAAERLRERVLEQRQHQRPALSGIEDAGQPLLAGVEPLDRDEDVHAAPASPRRPRRPTASASSISSRPARASSGVITSGGTTISTFQCTIVARPSSQHLRWNAPTAPIVLAGGVERHEHLAGLAVPDQLDGPEQRRGRARRRPTGGAPAAPRSPGPMTSLPSVRACSMMPSSLKSLMEATAAAHASDVAGVREAAGVGALGERVGDAAADDARRRAARSRS